LGSTGGGNADNSRTLRKGIETRQRAKPLKERMLTMANRRQNFKRHAQSARQQRRRKAVQERMKRLRENAPMHPRGDELDRLMDEDRLWFEAHPDRNYRARFAVPVELFDLDRFDGGLSAKTVAVVTAVKRLGPGLRARNICQYSQLFRHPDSWSDHDIAPIFESDPKLAPLSEKPPEKGPRR
jgi:hypothetical protein